MYIQSVRQLGDPFGSTVVSPIGESGLAPLNGGGGSESPSRVKPDWNCLLHILAFSFTSDLIIPFSLSDVIPNVSFLRDLTNDQNFLLNASVTLTFPSQYSLLIDRKL